MVPLDFLRVLDRAKVILGPRGDRARKGQHTIGICTVSAREFFNGIQVLQMAVKGDVVAAAHLGHAVDRKATGLLQTDTQTQQHKGHDWTVDDRSGQQVPRPVGYQPVKETRLQSRMRLMGRLLKLYRLPAQPKQQAGLLLMQGVEQLGLQCTDLIAQRANLWGHASTVNWLLTWLTPGADQVVPSAA